MAAAGRDTEELGWRLVQAVDVHLPRALNLIGTIGLATFSVLDSGRWMVAGRAISKTFVLCAVSAVLFAWGYLVEGREQKRVASLQSQLVDSQAEVARLEDSLSESIGAQYELLLGQLRDLHQRAGFLHSERISAYGHDGSHFVLLARYSSNPTYCQRGRGAYPADEGSIALAWRAGSHAIDNLPDPTRSPARWTQAHVKLGLPKSVARNLQMPTRSLYGRRVDTPEDEPIGLLMFESTRVQVLRAADLDRLLDDDHHLRSVARSIVKLRSVQPNLDYARSEGFG